MQIPLHQFEQHIDETILKRGLTYFKKGYVNPPDEISKGVFLATVDGTEKYTVKLQLQHETIEEFNCDCPYDHGPVCKHVAAVIFYFQRDALGLEQKSPTAKPVPDRTKRKTRELPNRKTIAQQVDELLESLSHDDLVHFVRDRSKSDTAFRKVLLSTFAHLNKNESKAYYKQQLKAILKSIAERDGFIGWHAARHVGKAVGDILETGRSHFNNKNYRSALLISCSVMEVMTEALNYADDSNGDIGNTIETAFRLLVDLAVAEVPQDVRNELFEYLLSTFEKGIFSGWDWHLGLLSIAKEMIVNETDADKIIALLDQVEKEEYDFSFRKAQIIKLNILNKCKGKEEAEKFMEQNLSNPSMRKEVIQNAISKKDYEKAIAVARDGIEHDAKDRPGYVVDWYDWLLKIALEQKDTARIVEYARLIFINSIREKQLYYDILKAHVAIGEWTQFVEALVADIKNATRSYDVELIAMVYVNEEMWDELFAFLKQEFSKGRISMDFLKQYEKYLKQDYSKELATLYEQGITGHLEMWTGRKHYRYLCRYIRRMIKLGEKGRADKLIAKLRADYPQRRALMDELDHV